MTNVQQEVRDREIKSETDMNKLSLQEANKKLNSALDSLRMNLMCGTSNAAIIAILQDNPCRLKCFNDIRNRKYDNNIDSYYSGRHDWVRKKLIDAILDKFGHLVEVKAEHQITNGRLDIAVLSDKIELRYGRKAIAVEIKSGHSVDSKLFNQIQRYLTEVDLLIMVRVPANDVIAIDSALVIDVLINDIEMMIRKIGQLISNNLVRVSGEWCKGCMADCSLKRPAKYTTEHIASFKDHEKYIKNVRSVIEKSILILENELSGIDGKTNLS